MAQPSSKDSGETTLEPKQGKRKTKKTVTQL